jgi:hypothetical protein
VRGSLGNIGWPWPNPTKIPTLNTVRDPISCDENHLQTGAPNLGKIVTIIALVGLGIAFVLWLLFALIFPARLSGVSTRREL